MKKASKKIFAFILVLTLLTGVFVIPASAEAADAFVVKSNLDSFQNFDSFINSDSYGGFYPLSEQLALTVGDYYSLSADGRTETGYTEEQVLDTVRNFSKACVELAQKYTEKYPGNIFVLSASIAGLEIMIEKISTGVNPYYDVQNCYSSIISQEVTDCFLGLTVQLNKMTQEIEQSSDWNEYITFYGKLADGFFCHFDNFNPETECFGICTFLSDTEYFNGLITYLNSIVPEGGSEYSNELSKISYNKFYEQYYKASYDAAKIKYVEPVKAQLDAIPEVEKVDESNFDELINSFRPLAKKAVWIVNGFNTAYTGEIEDFFGASDKMTKLYDQFKEYYYTIQPWGDSDNNKITDSSDALKLLQYSVGKAELDEQAKKWSDVNGDTKIDSSDALQILQYTVGKVDLFDACDLMGTR